MPSRYALVLKAARMARRAMLERAAAERSRVVAPQAHEPALNPVAEAVRAVLSQEEQRQDDGAVHP